RKCGARFQSLRLRAAVFRVDRVAPWHHPGLAGFACRRESDLEREPAWRDRRPFAKPFAARADRRRSRLRTDSARGRGLVSAWAATLRATRSGLARGRIVDGANRFARRELHQRAATSSLLSKARRTS